MDTIEATKNYLLSKGYSKEEIDSLFDNLTAEKALEIIVRVNNDKEDLFDYSQK